MNRLIDHGVLQARWCSERRRRWRIAREFGHFVSIVAAWAWFATFTFRRTIPLEESTALVGRFLMLLTYAVNDAGWIIAAEVGRLGGRVHVHGLISGVLSLEREPWRKLACQHFGRTTIEIFDPTRAASFYATKTVAGDLATFDLGGTLRGADLSRFERPLNIQIGRSVIVPSAKHGLGKFWKWPAL